MLSPEGPSDLMRRTPTIPKNLRGFRHDQYVNVYERLPQEPRFFATEDLFCDWDADVLLFAQDCGSVAALDQRIHDGHKIPHGHGETLPTNTKLRSLVEQNEIFQPKLYGSALGSLWRRSAEKRGMPPAWDALLPSYVIPALEWVASETRFSAIACLGRYSWEAVMVTGGKEAYAREWAWCRDSEESVDVMLAGRAVRAFPMFHPAYPRSYEVIGRNWTHLKRFLTTRTAS